MDPCQNCMCFPCVCDLDQANPVEGTADDWRDIYADMGDDYDDFMDRDCSMNG